MSKAVHFEIGAKDPEKMVAFYEAALGWEINVWEGPGEPYWLVTAGPEGTPGIGGAIMTQSYQQPVINTMQIESLDASLEKVKAAGGKQLSGPDEIPGVGTFAYCADPEGCIFGLLQAAGEEGD